MKKIAIVLGIILVLIIAFKVGKVVVAVIFSALYTIFGLGLLVLIIGIVALVIYLKNKKKTTP
jgi:membrane protein YdbS with pleckstrin-like domain